MKRKHGEMRWCEVVITLSVAVLGLGGTAREIRGGGGPENVAVVVNADSWASKTIAHEYLHLRGVPSVNVIYLRDIENWETTNVDSFRQRILLPVMTALYERGVWRHIDCIAYSADLPTAVDLQSDFASVKLAKHQTTVGSINGLTYLYQFVLAKRPEYANLDVNFYMRRPLHDVASIPIAAEDQRAAQRCQQLLAAGAWQAALEILQPLAARLPSSADLHYGLACCLARLQRHQEAVDALTLATRAGWSNRQHAESDTHLENLRERADFQAVLAKMDENASRPFEVQPTTAFRSTDRWNRRGQRVADQGPQYMLSTVLAVTSGRGNSVTEALQSLRSCVAADGSRPAGTIYFLEDSDVRAQTRSPAFLSAVKALEEIGVTGRVVPGKLPQGKQDVAGAMLGTATFDWKASGSTILPGAIGEHLTSFGGALQEGQGQTPLTEFIRHGAAGSSGTVTEPYSIAAKFPSPFLHVHYARGCSLAEAFYQSVLAPYQLLIVGDPLCQPWAQRLKIAVDRPRPRECVSGTIVVTPAIVGGTSLGAQLDRYEAFVDGRSLAIEPQARTITIDTRPWGDGWHELSIVAVAQGELAVRSSLVLPLVVSNGTGAVELERADDAGPQVRYGDSIAVRARAPVAAPIDVVNWGEVLGTVQGPEAVLPIDSRHLALGPARLQARTKLQGKVVSSPPLELDVTAPAPLAALVGIDAQRLSPGIALRVDGVDPVVIDSTSGSQWLAETKPAPGKKLELEGHFLASIEDLYQLQFQGNAIAEVLIDGQLLWRAENPAAGAVARTAVPVWLAEGWHCLHVRGMASLAPSLTVRFGSHGCQSIDGKRFLHVAQ